LNFTSRVSFLFQRFNAIPHLTAGKPPPCISLKTLGKEEFYGPPLNMSLVNCLLPKLQKKRKNELFGPTTAGFDDRTLFPYQPYY
jgi:hypothetical protein